MRGLRQEELDGSRACSFLEDKPLRRRQVRKLGSSWGNPRCFAPVDEDDRKNTPVCTQQLMHKPREGGCTRQARRKAAPKLLVESVRETCGVPYERSELGEEVGAVVGASFYFVRGGRICRPAAQATQAPSDWLDRRWASNVLGGDAPLLANGIHVTCMIQDRLTGQHELLPCRCVPEGMSPCQDG